MVETRPATLNRKLLGEFLKNPETIKAFENLSFNSEDLAEVITGIQSAAVIVLSLSDLFENERVASTDGEVQLTDGGPGGTLTFGLSDTGVSAGVYGSASQTVQFSVNAKGRVTLAQAHTLVTTNVTEGANLYFTDARARAALSSGTGISYNSGTGQISIAGNAITDGLLRQSSAFSVVGRSANTTGNVADITATSDGQVLRRSGSVLDFGALDLSLAGSVTGILPVARGGTGVASMTANALPKGNGTGAYTASNVSDDGNVVAIASGKGFSIARTGVTSPVANDGNVYSGTYTPTLTGVTNIDAVTANVCQYMRVGNVVTVSGMIGVDATAAGNYTFRASLPIASNLTAASQCNGALTTSGGLGYSRIVADTVNDLAQFDGNTSSAANNNASFSFTYLIA
ncbi:hypothetical protein M527_06440 [Sphingobium indicum IP26]|uniref:Uncharacterized protein n=1 Tax=Sphingobium indicum F2 TaxID=1450518 RepID=A0A8E0WUU1_9SPHN|nr:hypothetical protein [Sphingobium indicum]EPR09762.1 hypothetical protein M527_06440 [Sphingobium indicum IP26]KER37288.1 hypothetical protein AL00_06355 [Sphingobium indicum F2]